MNLTAPLLSVIIAATCCACGARASLGSGALGSDGGASTFTFTIPLGSYSGCTSSMVTIATNFVGAAGGGGDGTITLAQDGDGVAATLAFDPFANGKVTFTPATKSSATFASGPFETVDFKGSNIAVATTTGSLVLVGDTLFVSLRGETTGAEVSAYFHCPVPASLPRTSVVANAPPSTAWTNGAHGSCTSSVNATNTSLSGGGSGSVTVEQAAGNLIVKWSDDVTSVCKSVIFQGTSDSDATLAAGQTCSVDQPCGPPPSLGPSPVPSEATLTNVAGAMTVDGQSLFINLVGDTTALTCGRHYVSILCALAGN